MNVLLHMLQGLLLGTWCYPCHCSLGDPMVPRLEDVSSQSESSDVELVHATPFVAPLRR